MLHFLLGLADVSEPNVVVSLGSLIYVFLGRTWFSVSVSLLFFLFSWTSRASDQLFHSLSGERWDALWHSKKSASNVMTVTCAPAPDEATVHCNLLGRVNPSTARWSLHTHTQASISLLARAFVTSVLTLHIVWSCSFLWDLIEEKFSLKDPTA